MTLDLPDWTHEHQVSGVRFIGTIDLSTDGSGNGAGHLDIALAELDRALIVIGSLDPSTTSCVVTIETKPNLPPSATYVTLTADMITSGRVQAGWVDPGIDQVWRVAATLTGGVSVPSTLAIWADNQPVVHQVLPGGEPIPVMGLSPFLRPPGGLLRAQATVTSGAANTEGFANVIPAVTGKRIYVWSWSASVVSTASTPARTMYRLVDTAHTTTIDRQSRVGFDGAMAAYSVGGLPHPDGAGVGVDGGCMSDAAALAVSFLAYYTAE